MADTPSSAAPTTKAVNVRAVVGFLVFVELISGITQGYYSAVLPRFGASMHVGPAQQTLFNSVNLLASAALVPVMSRLGDQFGHRKMLRIAAAITLAGMLMIALAPSWPVVLLGRILIAAQTVWLPLDIAIVRLRVGGPGAASAIGLLVGFLTGGVLLGSLLAAVFATAPITVVMMVPALLSVICLIILAFLIPETTERAEKVIDWPGIALLVISLTGLLWALDELGAHGLGSAAGLIVLAVSVALLIWWVRVEQRVAAPAINVRVLASRPLWPAFLIATLFGMVQFGMQSPIASYLAADPTTLGYGFGMTSAGIGIMQVVATLAMVAGNLTFAPISRHLGLRLTVGAACVIPAIGFVFMAGTLHTSWLLIPAYLMFPYGAGLLMAALPAVVSRRAPTDEIGMATGVYNSLRSLGGSIAGGLFGAVLGSLVLTTTTGNLPSAAAYGVLFCCCTVIYLTAGVIGVTRIHHEEGASQHAAVKAPLPVAAGTE